MRNNILMNPLEGRGCTGCSMCGAVCPKKAMQIELTQDGFYEPTIDDSLCIDCGICKKVCYKFDKEVSDDAKTDYICYSAINKDDNELSTATSGGVSNELMKECIKQGYKVVGVAYDYEKDIAVTKMVDTIDQLEQFKGSKYFQSYTLEAFEKIVKDKIEQKYAIFGTPCQIYAISKHIDLKKNRDKFVLVDLFCHGCPSMKLWEKYLDYSKDKFKVSKFKHIEFRSKAHGWHEFGFKFSSEDKNYTNKKINDPFYEMFFDMNTHNKACYDCKMRSSLVYTDIRMGDFWGHQYDTDMKGVSAVVIGSEKGKEIFEKVKNKFIVKKHSFVDTVQAQSYGKPHYYNNDLREKTFRLLRSDMSLEKLIEEYRCSYRMPKKIKRSIKNLFKLLPKNIYFKIEKILHSI